MEIELKCSCCPCRLAMPPETSAREVMKRMVDEGPWFGLLGGATFEDMIVSTLLQRGSIRCPECRAPLHLSETSLARLADMLESFNAADALELPFAPPAPKPR